MSYPSSLAEEWEVDEEVARRAAVRDAARSREWIGARIARDWLMEELRCTNYTAEASLSQVAGSAVSISVRKLRADTLTSFDTRDSDGSWESLKLPCSTEILATKVCRELFAGHSETSNKVRFDQDWITGIFKLVDLTLDGDEDFRVIEATGVSFNRSSFIEHFDLGDLPPQGRTPLVTLRQEAPRRISNGGRPASKHGDVIAAVTLRLAALTRSELGRYTVESLATELDRYYQEVGENPPNDRNRETYAAGILRVLRARET